MKSTELYSKLADAQDDREDFCRILREETNKEIATRILLPGFSEQDYEWEPVEEEDGNVALGEALDLIDRQRQLLVAIGIRLDDRLEPLPPMLDAELVSLVKEAAAMLEEYDLVDIEVEEEEEK